MWDPRVTLVVRTRAPGGTDALGNEGFSLAEAEDVPGCLLAPGTPQDLAVARPEGVVVSATAHLPVGYGRDLRGARVTDPAGRSYEVVGDPAPYLGGALPDGWPWGMVVMLREVEG